MTASKCWFPKGHFWSANPGVQECLWCFAKRVDPAVVQIDPKPQKSEAKDG